MQDDNRRFEQLLQSLTARESSTLVIATVASSASLVILALSFEHSLDWLNIAGYMFPILGLAYRELTLFTVDRADLKEIELLMGQSMKHHIFDKKSYFKWARQLRRGLFRGMLLLPSYLWVFKQQTTPVLRILEGLALLFLISELNYLQHALEKKDATNIPM